MKNRINNNILPHNIIRKSKKFFILIQITITIISLSGCWDKIELNNRAFVSSIGIDKYEQSKGAGNDGGEDKNKFSISLSIADLSAYEGSGKNNAGGDEEAESKNVKKSSGETLANTLRLSERYSSQRMFFGHTKLIVFGSGLLEDKDLFKTALDGLEREKEITRRVLVMATDKTAGDIVSAKLNSEPLAGVFASNFYKTNAGVVGSTIQMDLEKTAQMLREGGNCLIPKISNENGNLIIGGLAVISNYSLAGWLDEMETKGYLWFAGNTAGSLIIAEANDLTIPYRVLRHSNKIYFTQSDDGQLICNIEISTNGNIEEYYFDKSLYSDTEISKIESFISDEIIEQVLNTIDIFQNRFKTDALDFDSKLKKDNFELWQIYNEDWEQSFRNMEVKVYVETDVKGIGMTK